MNKTTQRALRATAALAGLATALGMTGTALAATPAGENLAQTPSHPIPGDAGAATPGMSAPTSTPQLHSFTLPRSAPTKHSHSHSNDSHSDNSHSDNSHSDNSDRPDGGGPEHQSGADKYTEDDSPGYATHRSGNKALKRTEANHKYGNSRCRNQDSVGYGFNGNPNAERPNSDDYDPDCDGYHADKGANRYVDDGYVGTDSNRRNDGDYRFGSLL
jgi:hypothetical protein